MTAPNPHCIETDMMPVPVRGEAPGEVLWRGRQWAVTDRGLEALDGTYLIKAEDLDHNFDEWSHVRQLGSKSEWVDLPDFATAFMVAIVLHGKAPGFDPARIMKDYSKAARGL